jgi:LAO/AO transport system kinase
MPRRSPVELLERARAGERGAVARLISLVEQGGEGAEEVGRLCYPLGGQMLSIGLTGAPGAGKSTLTGGLIGVLRSQGVEVAVLAIDPSSPFSGGAILGDRVRMQEHFLDAGVFIRSMATRGHLGGLAASTSAAVNVLDAVGFPFVLIETVGVGQVEVEVAGAADTTVVTVNPGWGDAVQANKAGLMEIADLFVINKADRPGVAETRRDLEQMLDLSTLGEWRPPVVTTVGATGEGIVELWKTIASHQSHLAASGGLARRRAARAEEDLHRIVVEVLHERAERLWRSRELAGLRTDLTDRRIDPWTAAEQVLALDG